MPTVAASALEELLGADFTDIRPLGEDGGLSRLFRAHKQSLDVDVVIKRMRMDPRRPADVQREARVMTSLRHQFLPRIFDFKTDGEGYCYTIMELIPGAREPWTRSRPSTGPSSCWRRRPICTASVPPSSTAISSRRTS